MNIDLVEYPQFNEYIDLAEYPQINKCIDPAEYPQINLYLDLAEYPQINRYTISINMLINVFLSISMIVYTLYSVHDVHSVLTCTHLFCIYCRFTVLVIVIQLFVAYTEWYNVQILDLQVQYQIKGIFMILWPTPQSFLDAISLILNIPLFSSPCFQPSILC